MVICPVFSNPLVNDYVSIKTRARGIGYMHLGINFGLLLAATVLYNFTHSLEPKLTFTIAAAFAGVSALIVGFLIVEPKKSELLNTDANESHITDMAHRSAK